MSLSAASEAGCPAQARVQASRSRCAARAAGTSGSPAAPGLGDQVVGGPAERFRRVEQRRIRGQQGDPAVPAPGGQLLLTGLGPAQRLRPVQGQPEQARGDPGG